MPNLEDRISEWRRQMLAAGIKAPAPLEELESHLRDEIMQQTKSGINELDAFNSAVQKIGLPGPLRNEFKKTALYDILSQRRTLKIPLSISKLLGLVWLISLLIRYAMPRQILNDQSLLKFFITYAHASNGRTLLPLLIVSAALVGGTLLIFDSKWGNTIIRIVATIWLALGSFQYCMGVADWASFSFSGPPYLAFLLVSILILHLPEKANLKTTVTL